MIQALNVSEANVFLMRGYFLHSMAKTTGKQEVPCVLGGTTFSRQNVYVLQKQGTYWLENT